MSWVVETKDTGAETIIIYRRVWIFYVLFLAGILLGLVSFLELPFSRTLQYACGCLYVVSMPALVWFTWHFWRNNRPGATYSGNKLSRKNPLTLRIPRASQEK